MDLGLSGRVAVVTGASRGIGLAIVRTLAEEGASVVAASRIRPGRPRDAGADHRADGGGPGDRRRGRPAGVAALGLHDRRGLAINGGFLTEL